MVRWFQIPNLILKQDIANQHLKFTFCCSFGTASAVHLEYYFNRQIWKPSTWRLGRQKALTGKCLHRYIFGEFYLDPWSGFEAAKTAPWPSRGLQFLEPSDEWAGRGCYCVLMRWHSWAFLADQEWAQETSQLKMKGVSLVKHGR